MPNSIRNKRIGITGTTQRGSYLLDVVKAQPVGAYSLRRLSTAYAGPVVTVRRDSDNAEQDIGTVGEHFDSASLISFLGGANGFVSRFYDQSGKGNHQVQTTAAAQFRIVDEATEAVFTNRYKLYSPTGGAAGKYYATTLILRNNSFSGMVVMRASSGSGGLLQSYEDPTYTYVSGWIGTSWFTVGSGLGPDAGVAIQPFGSIANNNHILCGRKKNNEISIWSKGAFNNVNQVNHFTTFRPSIGGGSGAFEGHFAEVLWFNHGIEVNEVVKYHKNQMKYYGIN